MFNFDELTPDNIWRISPAPVTSSGSGGTLQIWDYQIPADGRIYLPICLYVRTICAAVVATRKIGYIISGAGWNTRYYYLDETGWTTGQTGNNSYGIGTTGALNGGITANGYVRAGGLPIIPLTYPDDFVLICQNDQNGDQFVNMQIEFLRTSGSAKDTIKSKRYMHQKAGK